MASANDAPHRLQNLRDDALASPHVPQMTSPFCGGRLGLAASTLGGLRGAVAVGFTSPVPAASALVGAAAAAVAAVPKAAAGAADGGPEGGPEGAAPGGGAAGLGGSAGPS